MPIEILRPVDVPVGGANDWALTSGGENAPGEDKAAAVDPGDPIVHDDNSSAISEGRPDDAQDFLLAPFTSVASTIRSVTVWIRARGLQGSQANPQRYGYGVRAVLNGVSGDNAFTYYPNGRPEDRTSLDWNTYPEDNIDGPRSEINIPPLLPKPGGGRWTIAELVDGLVVRLVNDSPAQTSDVVMVTSLWAKVDFIAVPAKLAYARTLASMRLRKHRATQHRVQLPVGLSFLDYELGDRFNISHFALPNVDSPAEHDEEELRAYAQLRSTTIDLNKMKLTHEYEIKREYLVLDWHVSVSGIRTTARNESGARLTRGSFFFARSDRAYVLDPASKQVAEIELDVPKYEVDGLLIEGDSSGNTLENAAFQDGIDTDWTAAGATASEDTDNPRFERETWGSLLLPSGASREQDSTEFPANSRITLSVDHVETAGATLQVRLRRSDGLYWSGSNWLTGDRSVDITARSSWARDALRNIPLGGTARTVRVRVLADSGEVRVGHVQLEASRWPSSRKLIRGSTESDEFYMTNEPGSEVWIPGGGSYRAEVRFPWAADEITEEKTILYVFEDAQNYEWLFYSTAEELIFRRVRAGVVTDATISATVESDRNYVIGCRWNSSYVLSVFWDGEKGVDGQAVGDNVYGAGSRMWRGSRGGSSNNPMDGWFRYHEVTQQVLTDEEMAQFP